MWVDLRLEASRRNSGDACNPAAAPVGLRFAFVRGGGGACAHRRRCSAHTDLGCGAEHGGCTSALLWGEHSRAGGLRCCRLMSFDTPCLLPQRPPPFSFSSPPPPRSTSRFLSFRHTPDFTPSPPTSPPNSNFHVT